MSDLSLPKRGKLECTKKKLTFDNNFYFKKKKKISELFQPKIQCSLPQKLLRLSMGYV